MRKAQIPVELEKIRKSYSPDKYRVAHKVYSASDIDWLKGTSPFGSMAPCRCYVFYGAITFQFDDQEIEIRAGESKLLPGGEYSFRLVGDEVELAQVWEL